MNIQHIFKDDPVWEPKAKALAEKTYELTQFIVDVLKIEDVGATFKGKVTYHTILSYDEITWV